MWARSQQFLNLDVGRCFEGKVFPVSRPACQGAKADAGLSTSLNEPGTELLPRVLRLPGPLPGGQPLDSQWTEEFRQRREILTQCLGLY